MSMSDYDYPRVCDTMSTMSITLVYDYVYVYDYVLAKTKSKY